MAVEKYAEHTCVRVIRLGKALTWLDAAFIWSTFKEIKAKQGAVHVPFFSVGALLWV